jgi:hypothetical protein
MGKALFVTLKRTFPFVIKMGKTKTRSMWCNEKVHSILHAPSTIIQMGRSQNVSCQVTELRHKGVKRKGSRTNRNPGTAGFSIMNQELRESACQRMAQDLDACGETCICMYTQLFVCICTYITIYASIMPYIHVLPEIMWRACAGPRWHKRRRVDHNTASEDSDSGSDSGSSLLLASRYWERKEQKKTEGCMADGLRCCIWGRAQSPGTVSLELTKGWSGMYRSHKLGHRGNLGLSMEDLAWTAATGLSEPVMLSLFPSLSYLPQKLVHFVVDYHPTWISHLQLPSSDGSHRQLHTHHFQQALQRLENMPEVDMQLQLFSAVDIQHKDWVGSQTLHADPFKKEKSRMVSSDIGEYVQILQYTNIHCTCK